MIATAFAVLEETIRTNFSAISFIKHFSFLTDSALISVSWITFRAPIIAFHAFSIYIDITFFAFRNTVSVLVNSCSVAVSAAVLAATVNTVIITSYIILKYTITFVSVLVISRRAFSFAFSVF